MWLGRSACAVSRNQTSEGSRREARDHRVAVDNRVNRGRVISRGDNQDPNSNLREDNLARRREEGRSKVDKDDQMAGLKASQTAGLREDRVGEGREDRRRRGRESRDRGDRSKGNKIFWV